MMRNERLKTRMMKSSFVMVMVILLAGLLLFSGCSLSGGQAGDAASSSNATGGVANNQSNEASNQANAASNQAAANQSTGNQASNEAANQSSGGQSASKVTFPLTLTIGGQKVTLKSKPQRIVSATLGTDNTLLPLVGKGRMLAVTKYAFNPVMSYVSDQVNGLTKIDQANAEQIIGLKPDLVFLSSFTKSGVVQQVRDSGITVVQLTHFDSFDDIRKNTLITGKLVGEPAKAQQMVDRMNNQLKLTAQAVQGQPKPEVLYYTPGDYVPGSKTIADDLIRAAGGKNAAAGAGISGWKKVDTETIVKMNPDVIVVEQAPYNQGLVTKIKNNPAFKNLKAVKNGQIYALKSKYLTTVSPFIYQGVQKLAQLLHPAAFD